MLSAPGITEEQLLSLAYALENQSEHPLARAVVEYLSGKSIKAPEVTEFLALSGMGVSGQVEGKLCLAGSARLMRERGIEGPLLLRGEALAQDGQTPLYFAQDGRILGVISVSDSPKQDSAEAISALKRMDLLPVMLTGDNETAAKVIAGEVGIDRVVAQVLPQDKEREVRRLMETRRVAMVGDGVNDAPALKRAEVGIAIGAGTDVAVEAADVILMRGSLKDAATSVSLSRSIMRNIRQNLFWALFYNCIGIPIAAGVFYPVFGWQLSPMFAAAAMSFSSVCVVSNALRLRRFKAPFEVEDKQREQIKGEESMEKQVMISGMMCQKCVQHVQSALEALGGPVRVSLADNCAWVPAHLKDQEIKDAVSRAGYEVTDIR